jgi:hypothetical protein
VVLDRLRVALALGPVLALFMACGAPPNPAGPELPLDPSPVPSAPPLTATEPTTTPNSTARVDPTSDGATTITTTGRPPTSRTATTPTTSSPAGRAESDTRTPTSTTEPAAHSSTTTRTTTPSTRARPGTPLDIQAFDVVGGRQADFDAVIEDRCPRGTGSTCLIVQKKFTKGADKSDPDCEVTKLAFTPQAETAENGDRMLRRGTRVTATFSCPTASTKPPPPTESGSKSDSKAESKAESRSESESESEDS